MADDRRRAINGLAEIDYDEIWEDDEPDNIAPRRRPPFNPASYRGPGGRQNSIIVHSLVGQRRATYIVDRDVLLTLLPRARERLRHGALVLSSFFHEPYLQGNREDLVNWALDFLFQYLSEYLRTEAINMLGAAMQDIEYDPIRIGAINDWAARMNALCVVLNNDEGLGCSEDLLGEILDFFEFLIHEVHNLLGWDEVAHLFEAFAGIVRTNQRNQVDQIRRIWNQFDPEVQAQVLGDMRRALPVEDIDGKAHRMYRTLGY
ncbi:hypothetical protein IL306_008226 [Fusarium sp. DS 682]|nr:hypothetical protein IL306_008226 [Fusarium sp. DS 682]